MQKTVNELIYHTGSDWDSAFFDQQFFQEKELDPGAFNRTFTFYEKTLNRLYEKVRSLEEIGNLTRLILNEQIGEQSAEIRDLIRQVEEMGDEFINKDYRTVPITFQHHHARPEINTEGLAACEIKNGRLVMASYETPPATIVKATKKSSYTTYRDNIEDYPRTGRYLTYYLMD